MKIDNIDAFGNQITEVSFDDKFNIIKKLHNFKKATIKGSAYSNELYLVDDTTKGIHTSWSGWRICDLEEWFEEEWSWTENKYISVLKGYKTITNNSLEEYCKKHRQEVTDWFNKYIDVGEYEKLIKEREEYYKKNSNYYYEVDFSKDKEYKIYVEGDNSIYIEGGKKGLMIEVGDLTLEHNDDNSILSSILNLMILNKEIVNSVSKLNNGYIFNNTYYEDKQDILYAIENHIDKNKLHTKFMNDGLTIDDFKEKRI